MKKKYHKTKTSTKIEACPRKISAIYDYSEKKFPGKWSKYVCSCSVQWSLLQSLYVRRTEGEKRININKQDIKIVQDTARTHIHRLYYIQSQKQTNEGKKSNYMCSRSENCLTIDSWRNETIVVHIKSHEKWVSLFCTHELSTTVKYFPVCTTILTRCSKFNLFLFNFLFYCACYRTRTHAFIRGLYKLESYPSNYLLSLSSKTQTHVHNSVFIYNFCVFFRISFSFFHSCLLSFAHYLSECYVISITIAQLVAIQM